MLGSAFSWEVQLRQQLEKRWYTAERERDSLRAKLARVQVELDASGALQRSLQELRGALEKQSSAAAPPRDNVEKQQAMLKDRDESHRELASQLEAQRVELIKAQQALRNAKQAADAERVEWDRQQAERAERIRKIEATLRERDGSIRELGEQLEAVRNELANYRLQAEKRREELERRANRLDERIKFLQSMALAALERAQLGSESSL